MDIGYGDKENVKSSWLYFSIATRFSKLFWNSMAYWLLWKSSCHKSWHLSDTRSAGVKCWSKMIRADLGTCDKELFHETWPWRLTMNFSCWQDKGQVCDINPAPSCCLNWSPCLLPLCEKLPIQPRKSGHIFFLKNFPHLTCLDS